MGIIFIGIGIGVVVAIVAGIVIAVRISTYNELVKLRNKVKNSWAHIDAQLQRRFDLIPNLVEIVKGFAEHEEKLLKNVSATRNNFANASSDAERIAMNMQLSSQLQSLYTVANHYPRLKSNAHFLELQKALTEIEEDISYARQFYNDAVTIYNNKLMQFPANMIASKHGFKEETYFDAMKEAEKAPKIRFKERSPLCPVCGATVTNEDDNCPYCGGALD
jgi:LemA protein